MALVIVFCLVVIPGLLGLIALSSGLIGGKYAKSGN